jgi:23S rRNA (uracil1939-C5)-methyltransferase
MPINPNLITRIAAKGEGVTSDGRFVPNTAPGDEVAPSGTITRGAHYQVPPCAHYGKCGGCTLQHIDDAAYSAYVAERITSALYTQGVRMEQMALRPPLLSPPHSRRRATLRAERRGRELLLGFHAKASHSLIDIRTCPVLHPKLEALLPPLKALLKSHFTGRHAATLQLTLADQGADVLITGMAVEGWQAAEALGAFAQAQGVARLQLEADGQLIPYWQPEPPTISFNGLAVALPPSSFLQATAEGEAAMRGFAQEALAGKQAIADLFAGLGTFALPLAQAAKLHAVEAAREPLLMLAQAAHRHQLPLTTQHRDLFRHPLNTKELAAFEAVVIDPPRAGAQAQMECLARSLVPCIVAASCNPATFARDAAILIAGGYALQSLQPIGQFRWSTHVELISLFTKA